VIGKITRGGVAGIFLCGASSLRFPYLFLLMSVLFVLNLLIPDMFPFADEVLMGLVAMLLANVRKKSVEDKYKESV
jgi:uncharacterized membrane protein YesL